MQCKSILCSIALTIKKQKKSLIIILIKDGRLSEKYKITLDHVKQAYPDIQWGGRS